jgi:lipid-binding SYLF domain-containing protein
MAHLSDWLTAAVLLIGSGGVAWAQMGEADANGAGEPPITGAEPTGAADDPAVYGGEELSAPEEDVYEAVSVAQQMHQDAQLSDTLAQARGVFIVPDYATAALLIGGSGGEGVMLQNDNGQWSDPVFYDVGGISVGAQAGVAAGSIAFVLMSDEAVAGFLQENNFSLDAEAGLTVINWAAKAEAAAGLGDVLVWTDTEGLLAELSVGVSDINFDEEETARFYGRTVTPQEVLAGTVHNPHADHLKSEFAEFTDTGERTGN